VEGGKTAVICESALCAISGEQEAGDLAVFVATGGSGKNKSAWVKHLEQATFTLISLDLDEPDENGKRPGDEGSLYWEKNLSYQVRWHPYKKDINDMLVAGSNIREWVQDGTDWYYTLLVAASEKYVLTPEPVTEEVPTAPEPIVENPISWDDITVDYDVCSACFELSIDTPAHYEHDGFMYCREHYPPLLSINGFIAKVEQDIPNLRGAKVEYWRTEDSERMKESILHKYQADVARQPRPSYSPVSLPRLPRKMCPCLTLGWNKDGGQTKQHCHGKATLNGFCEEHQLSYELLQIGAQFGYPEVRIPFRWEKMTLHRTIHAGIQGWEDRARVLHTERPQARKEDVTYLRQKSAQEVLN
jgi:hypothetical protein